MFHPCLEVVGPSDVPVATMRNFVLVASFLQRDGCFHPQELNQSLAVLTKGLITMLPGVVVIAALSWDPERSPPLVLEDVTGRDIVLALDKMKLEHYGLCNPDPSRFNLPSVPGLKITDFNNPFFDVAYGVGHGIESMRQVQVLRRWLRFKGYDKMFGCTLPFLLGLPWITSTDNDLDWVINKWKFAKSTNLRYLNFQFDMADERRLENIRLSRHEDKQAAPCHYGTIILVHLLGVKVYPYHVSALCDYLNCCMEDETTPCKEDFVEFWRSWCEADDGDDRDFISPYDTQGLLEDIEFSNGGGDNIWGQFGKRLIKDIESVSTVLMEDLWPVEFGDEWVVDDDSKDSSVSEDWSVSDDYGGASLTEHEETPAVDVHATESDIDVALAGGDASEDSAGKALDKRSYYAHLPTPASPEESVEVGPRTSMKFTAINSFAARVDAKSSARSRSRHKDAATSPVAPRSPASY